MKIEVVLKSVSLVIVGGQTPVGMITDVPFYRTPNNRLVIPGSTIKGVLRTISSTLAPSFGLSSCCTIKPEDMKDCDICEIFGRSGISLSALRVTSFKPVNEPKTDYITRVKINEKTGKAEEKALYNVEIVPPCTEFKGVISIYEGGLSKPKESLLLVLNAINMVRFNRLGRGDSIFDVRVENIDAVEGKLRELGLDPSTPEVSKVLKSLSTWFWDNVECGGGI